MWQPQSFYNQYVLRTPVILTGEGAVRGLYNYPSAKVAVIHGSNFSDNEMFEDTFSKKKICFFKRSWQGEPDFEGLQGTIRELEEFQPDTIIAVGGGSVIDGSKLCRLLYEFPYFDIRESRISGNLFKTRFIAIPTTIGSGAEVSSAAVFVNHDNYSKDMIVMHELQPEVVVYDKRYVENMSAFLLFTSALDAAAHMIEGYVSTIDNSFIDIMAEKGMAILHEELVKLFTNRCDVNYEQLQYAGYLGGVVQNHCIVGAAHAVAHQLTDRGYSHGEAVALLLPAVIMLNAENDSVKVKYDRVAHVAGFSSLEDLVYFIRRACEVSGIDKRKMPLKKLLIELSRDEEFCANIRNDKGGKGNPIEITDEYIVKLAEML